MSEQYSSPPFVEAVCEFIFSPDTPWDPTVPGLIYEMIKGEYPIKEPRLLTRFYVTTEAGGLEQRATFTEGIAFISEDRRSQILVAPRIVSIVYVKHYPSWPVFFQRIEYVYNLVNEIQTINGIDRIGLMYVDKIAIPGQEIDLKDYFNFRPEPGTWAPGSVMRNFSMECTFTYNDDRDTCKVKLKDAMPEDQSDSAFILTTDYSLAMPRSVDPDEVFQWIDMAHNTVKEMFEGCITEKAREMFRR